MSDPPDNRMLVQFTAADLRAIVRDEVNRAVKAITEAKPPSKSDRWIDVAGAAKHFKCSAQTIRNWIQSGAPARTFGPTAHPMVRIDLAEFEEWVDQSAHRKRGVRHDAARERPPVSYLDSERTTAPHLQRD